MTYLWTLINHALNLGIRCGLVVETLWPTIGNLSDRIIYHNIELSRTIIDIDIGYNA